MEALNDIGASEFLGVRTLTVSIYSTWVTRSDLPGAAQIALAMLARRPRTRAAGALGSTASALCQRRAASTADRSGPPVGGRWRRRGARRRALPIVIGFVIPFAYLAARRDRAGSAQRPAVVDIHRAAIDGHLRRRRHARRRRALGLAIAYSVGAFSGRNAAGVVTLASIGYATPGTVVAIALLPTDHRARPLDRRRGQTCWRAAARASCS